MTAYLTDNWMQIVGGLGMALAFGVAARIYINEGW